MPDSDSEAFPLRPMSTQEAVALKDDVGAFAHTAPFFGLSSLEDGPGTNSRAVVGLYVGFRGGGAHMMGFDPDADDWESVEVLDPDETTAPSQIIAAGETLERWLAERYPTESLVFYKRGNASLN